MADDDETFTCTRCDPPRNVTDQVLAARDAEMLVLRWNPRKAKTPTTWSVVIDCPGGHEVVFSGTR